MMSLFSFSTPSIHQKATGLRIDIFHVANLFVNPQGVQKVTSGMKQVYSYERSISFQCFPIFWMIATEKYCNREKHGYEMREHWY